MAKVFLVDSDPATRRQAISVLLPAGFEVLVGEGPFEATTAIRRAEPDLVILGTSMTHPFGLALIGRLFSLESTAEIPVIVIADTPEQAKDADRAGARTVLHGPVTSEQLLEATRQHVGMPGAIPQAPLSVLADEERLAAVAALIPAPGGDPDLDRFTRLAADMLATPVSMITLIERDRQVYASQVGVAEPWASKGGAPLEYSYCQYAITSRAPLVIADASQHPLVKTNPAVAETQAIAYAGMPLITQDGHAVGTLCAIDNKPRTWSEHELRILNGLADILTAHLNTPATGPGRHAA